MAGGAILAAVFTVAIRRRAAVALALGSANVATGAIYYVLRGGSGGPPDPPQPGLRDLAELIATTRATGMRIEFNFLIPPERPSVVLGRAAYRVVPEALTNAARHAQAHPRTRPATTRNPTPGWPPAHSKSTPTRRAGYNNTSPTPRAKSRASEGS